MRKIHIGQEMAIEKDFVVLNGIRYEWLGQSGIRMTTNKGAVVYIDPVLLDENPAKADLILITHHHVDHCLPEYIRAVMSDDTKAAAFHDSYLKYCVHDLKGVRTVKIGQTIEFDGIKATGTEAYTERGFHSRGEGCGFLIELEGQRVYFSGDTARIKEMRALKGIDVAILPVCDNTYTIKTGEIILAVKDIQPRLFIPVHFTPMDEPDPVIKEPFIATKDPRFFTCKFDPASLLPAFEGTEIHVGILRKLGRSLE